jgi:hypothetical protein
VPPRLFTLAEAEALLPQVIPLLEAIRDARRAIAAAEGELDRLLGPTRSNGHGVDPTKLDESRAATMRAMAELRAKSAELDALGVELKDPDTGLIDFQSRRQGRIVYLCWRLGEPRIDWWHELDAGFAGRLPLERED